MDNLDLNHFGKGTVVGLTQTLFGHPLDTLKTRKQNNSSVLFKSWKHLYRGCYYPLILSTSYNSLLFGFYTECKKRDYTSLQAGAITGLGLSWLITPFEYYKISEQVSITKELERIHKPKVKNTLLHNTPFRGSHYTALRETIGCGLYFHIYDTSMEYGIHSFLSGGLAGCGSWLFSYPLDTIKTRYQINPAITWKVSIKQGHLFHGIWFCLARAFLVNGIGFTIYELL